MNKRLAELISVKTGECYADVMRHVRTRLRFVLLKTCLIAIRGVRGNSKSIYEESVEEVSFNLIPLMNE